MIIYIYIYIYISIKLLRPHISNGMKKKVMFPIYTDACIMNEWILNEFEFKISILYTYVYFKSLIFALQSI